MTDHSNGADMGDANAQAIIAQIQNALEAIHNPQTNNDSRQAASSYLESVKDDDQAPYHGFMLAHDRSQQFIVRHFALSLLEHAIKHKWAAYTDFQSDTVRGWVIQLSQELSPDDPLYIRNKTAQLWVEVAKRCWASRWTDMDELLCNMWCLTGTLIHKEFVLFVLEALSEDVFSREDTAAALRDGELNRACVEIFNPADVLAKVLADRQIVVGLRSGDIGWLERVGDLLEDCLARNAVDDDGKYVSCAVKCLEVYRTAFTWMISESIAATACVQRLCDALAAPSITIQMRCVDALSSLLLRLEFRDSDFVALIAPMYASQNVNLMRKVYEWSIVDAHDVDDDKYVLAKKFSEMLSLLGNFVEKRLGTMPAESDIPGFAALCLSVARSQSFVVSIPILVTWTRLLKSKTTGRLDFVDEMIGPLLELCISRLLRYEHFPLDSDDPSMMFLLEDIDTIPERHAFLGNYRRYCVEIIELIVQRKRKEAIYHILTNVMWSLKELYSHNNSFSYDNYSKTSMAVLQVDAYLSVIEATLKAYLKWRTGQSKQPLPEVLKERHEIDETLEVWCNELLGLEFRDPIIRKKIISLSVSFCTSSLKKSSLFMMRVLESILLTREPARSDAPTYSEAVTELHDETLHDLIRIASKMPDQLLEIYDQLEARIQEILSSGNVEAKHKATYQTFLYSIILRAKNIDDEQRMQRLQVYLQPVQQMWQDVQMQQALASLDGFCDLLGLTTARQYLIRRRVHETEDWSQLRLDAEGQALQADIEARGAALPLRTTRVFLSASVDKLDIGSPAWNRACVVWADAIPLILPQILNFLMHAHAFYTPRNWTDLPVEMRPIVTTILTDRFWQSGISEGSKDDFYARVLSTKATVEGLASSIRKAVRTVKDACYNILYGMSRFDALFFGFQELPDPLARALFADAQNLSSHQSINLLQLARHLISSCPVRHRPHFVTPLLVACLKSLDSKIRGEWEQLIQKQQAKTEDEDLTNEMKEESILRHLTYNAVVMVADVMRPEATPSPIPKSLNGNQVAVEAKANGHHGDTPHDLMRNFCLSSTAILEPLLVFCTHAIQFRDTRCCLMILAVVRSLIYPFKESTEIATSIREYISSEVLKAGITSLHDAYFVDLHKELSDLIADIISQYAGLTATPRNMLLSLPGLAEAKIDRAIQSVCSAKLSRKQQRAVVLSLLKDLKGVSVSEQGRITKSAAAVRKERNRTKMQQEFMKVEEPTWNAGREPSPDLSGVAGMFDA